MHEEVQESFYLFICSFVHNSGKIKEDLSFVYLFTFEMHLNFHDFFLLFIEQKLSQDWPVSAEVDLDDMEYHEGKE